MITTGILFFVIKKTGGLRVTESEELQGLDLSEHNGEAYSGFQYSQQCNGKGKKV